jgi:hypothetical protein
MPTFDNPARINTSLDSRSISFENPTGERGKGGTTAGGRKGLSNRWLAVGEKIVLADIKGPGRIRHIWMTFMQDTPEEMRSVWMEVYYDDMTAPSISVPCLDFFGLPHGRTAAYDSALVSVHEGRGFNAYFPMPFAKSVRIEFTNSGTRPKNLYYQIDYTLEPFDHEEGYLHVPFHRENPTTLKKDFVIASGLRGPGRFIGSAIGIRVLQDGMSWYGEGEFKVYRDGDTNRPTICGTGLEDYVGSAWGMKQHCAFYSGVPINVEAPPKEGAAPSALGGSSTMPDFVSFYRWHLADPIVFQHSFKATIQQIGSLWTSGPAAAAVRSKYISAGPGWITKTEIEKALGPVIGGMFPPDIIGGLAERSDDYCAAAFIYCRDPQPVPKLDIKLALADIGLRPYEKPPSPFG